MKQEELQKILKLHEKWLNGEDGGVKANLSDANLCYADLRGANLSGADLRDANLCYANFRGANLRGANLSGADLNDANLSGANLSGADLIGADLRDANLIDADLCYANLRGANLRGANLSGADLRDANLCYADLCYADLSDADLRSANLSFALMDGFVYQLSRIGSSNRMTTFWADRDIVWCGCFTGTFKDWRDKIRKTYTADEEYRKQYEAALKYFAELAAVDGMTRFKEMLVEKER